MMWRNVVLAGVVVSAGLSAQGSDPDKKAAGTGMAPAGWQMALDRPTAKREDVAFSTSGAGVHVTTGPAAIFWRTADTASGYYTVRASFTQTKAAAHPEAYGLFFGAEQLGTDGATYLYFIVRQDGKFMVKHRANAKDVHTITDWTDAPSIAKLDAQGRATNRLEVRAEADSVRMFVNGAPVVAYSAKIMNPVAGRFGIRVNHNLDVQIDGLSRK